MKQSIFMFLLIGASMIFFCCSENNSTAPELSQSDQVTTTLAKTKTSFTATAHIVCPPLFISMGTTKSLLNGKKHIRGVEVRYDMIGDVTLLNGALIWNTNKNIEQDGKAKLWGTMKLYVGISKLEKDYEKAMSVWELTFHGYKIGPNVTLDVNGVGKEGKVKGMVTKWTMEMELEINQDTGMPYHCKKFFDSIKGYISK